MTGFTIDILKFIFHKDPIGKSLRFMAFTAFNIKVSAVNFEASVAVQKFNRIPVLKFMALKTICLFQYLKLPKVSVFMAVLAVRRNICKMLLK